MPDEKTAKAPPPVPVAAFCEREQIDRRTAWRWVQKGIVKATRVAPRTGVRLAYVEEDDAEE